MANEEGCRMGRERNEGRPRDQVRREREERRNFSYSLVRVTPLMACILD